MRYVSLVCLMLMGIGLMVVAPTSAQVVEPAPVMLHNPESAVVESATNVLNEIMAIPAQSIPRALLRDAQGIAIVPGMLKGGFVIGIRHGHGVVVIRDENGNWRAPSFINITGGSFGWQVGVQATDVVLVLKTQNSVRGLLNGRFTIGGDISAAAGPVGRDASAATDITLRSEIYSYSRSRGLFAGVALDGSSIAFDNAATAAYYRGTGILPGDGPPVQPPRLPPSAEQLLATIAMYSQPTATAPQLAAPTGPALVPVTQPSDSTSSNSPDVQAVREQLEVASHRLNTILDPGWQKYLHLPEEVYVGKTSPSPQALEKSLTNFNTAAANPAYRALTERPEFQQTYGLLRAYKDLLSATPQSTLALPPPPR